MNDASARGSALGAMPHESGTTFRVWAPFARGVAVVGDFNGWSPQASALEPEAGGWWFADVPEARAGDEYRYVIGTSDEQLSRIDPYAREVTNSAGNGVIRASEYDWGDAHYHTPSWDELVIYELHVGTFNDSPGSGPGSFQSVIKRLDYLQELGISAIEIMPSAEFAADFSWG